MVASWLLNSISKELADSVLYIDTTIGIWKDLIEHFSQENGSRIFQIQKSIASLAQGQTIITAYFTKLKALWEELSNYKHHLVCTRGAVKHLTDVHIQECIMLFLMGLNDSYSQVRGPILLVEPHTSIIKVFSLTVQVERHRDIAYFPLQSAENNVFFTHTQGTQNFVNKFNGKHMFRGMIVLLVVIVVL